MTILTSTVLPIMGVCRVLIGLAPFVAARATSRLLGFPDHHDTPTTRLMARLFGGRDVGLGVLVFYALRHPEMLPFVLLFNACMDAGDFVSAAIPLLRRQGIDRAAIGTASMAFFAGSSWVAMWLFLQ